MASTQTDKPQYGSTTGPQQDVHSQPQPQCEQEYDPELALRQQLQDQKLEQERFVACGAK